MRKTNVQPIKEEANCPLIPLQDIVILERFSEDKSSSGILLPGSAGEYTCGRVVAVGPGRVFSSFMDATGHHQVGQFIPVNVKVGDFVIFGKYQSFESILVDGKQYIMCREGDLGARSANGKPIKVKLANQD